METKINVVSPSEHELEVTLGYEEILPEIEEAYKEERKRINLPGFRKGKVPLGMIKKMAGEAIEQQASEKIANKKFWDIAEEQKLEPISTPQMVDLNYEKDVKLFFKIRYEIKPKLELKDYTGQEIQKLIFTINDEEVDKEIEYLQRTNSTTEAADTVNDKYNIITVDLQKIDKDGNPEAGARSNGLKIDLTEPRINQQIIDNAIGKNVGDTFNFEFQDQSEVEEEGVKKLVDSTIRYEASIKEINKIVLPDVNEEFVKKISRGKFSSPEEWKENIRSGIQKYYDAQSEDMLVNSLLSKVIKNNDFEPPHGYVHLLLERMVKSEEEKAKQDGSKRFDANEAHKRLHDNAVTTAKWQIIKENLVEKENIKVSENALREMAEKESAETGISVDKMMKYYIDSNRDATLLDDMVIDFLKKNNNIKEVNVKDLNNGVESNQE